jgi:YHS domain-containing protein
MRINKIDAFDMDYEGQSYYFCAVPCREKLTREPDRYRQRRPESGGCGSAPCMTFEAAKKGLERDAEKLHSLEESIDALKRRVSHGPVE